MQPVVVFYFTALEARLMESVYQNAVACGVQSTAMRRNPLGLRSNTMQREQARASHFAPWDFQIGSNTTTYGTQLRIFRDYARGSRSNLLHAGLYQKLLHIVLASYVSLELLTRASLVVGGENAKQVPRPVRLLRYVRNESR